MTIEYRQLVADNVEMRADGDGMSFTGYASRYNVKSEWLGFTETVATGAWTRTLKSRNEIKAFVNHDTNMVLGSTRAGTLRLSDDERGLFSEIDLPETTYGKDLSISVGRRDVSGMSVGFSVVKDEWNDDYSQRTIIEARLHEVSPVTGFPAFRQTSATVRALGRLLHRTGQDPDALAAAMDRWQAGEDLTAEQRALLIASLGGPDDPAGTDPVVDESEVLRTVPVALARRRLQLMALAH